MATSTTPAQPGATRADATVGGWPVWSVQTSRYHDWGAPERDAMATWLAAHDIPPGEVPIHPSNVVLIYEGDDGLRVRTWRICPPDEYGRAARCPNCLDCLKHERVDVALVADPPTLAGEWLHDHPKLGDSGRALTERLRARREVDRG